MKAYAVIQKYHDDGRVKAEIKQIDCDRFPTCGVYQEHETFDKYIDYFKTQEEAEIFLQEGLNA